MPPKTQNKPKPSSPKLDIQKELEETRRMLSDSTTRYRDIKKQNRPMPVADKKYVYGLEDIDEDVYVPSAENIFKNSSPRVSYGNMDTTPLQFSYTQPVFRDFQALRPQPSMYNKIKEQFRTIDVDEPILRAPKNFKERLEEARKQVDELTPIYQRLKEKITPQPSILPKPRKIKKTKGDPANLSTWPVVDLKQFMREHNLKGVSKKKSELVATIQKYIS
jgi:hypothetical protein